MNPYETCIRVIPLTQKNFNPSGKKLGNFLIFTLTKPQFWHKFVSQGGSSHTFTLRMPAIWPKMAPQTSYFWIPTMTYRCKLYKINK